jgi:hypothetical protein
MEDSADGRSAPLGARIVVPDNIVVNPSTRDASTRFAGRGVAQQPRA